MKCKNKNKTQYNAEKANKYYSVVRGKEPAIYDKWEGLGGAKEQVDGYSNCKHKSFSSLEEAIGWYVLENIGSFPGIKFVGSFVGTRLFDAYELGTISTSNPEQTKVYILRRR
jgi:hypothetical protein